MKRNARYTLDSRTIFLLLAAAFIIVLILFVIVAIQTIKASSTSAAAAKAAVATTTAQAAVALEQTLTPQPTPLPTLTPTVALPPNAKTTCMYQVEEGDTLFHIMEIFNLKYNAQGQYYSRECTEKSGLLMCNQPELIQYHPSIYISEWIEIPQVSQESCLKYGGKTGVID